MDSSIEALALAVDLASSLTGSIFFTTVVVGAPEKKNAYYVIAEPMALTMSFLEKFCATQILGL